METGLVRITDLSRRLDMSSRTLRYYEQVGLIASVRPDGEKLRYYTPKAVERLQQILILRKMEIPIKDILRIYESQDMGVVVEAFAQRIRRIDEQVTALSELKRIVNEFLQTMMKHGITQISALPLLYEEMDKQLSIVEKLGPVSYERLSAISEQLEPPPEARLVTLPAMRALYSVFRETGAPDPDGFFIWLQSRGVPLALPGENALFEHQNDAGQSVFLHRIPEDFANDGPYVAAVFPGGLFAVSGVYLDQDVRAFYRRMVQAFDGNAYYEVDFAHGGRLRHEPLVQNTLSPDGQRERVELYLPLKQRLPNASLYAPGERVEGLSSGVIQEANPIRWSADVPMDGLIPILSPHYRVTENGEAEYVAYIDKRLPFTGVSVKVPFRVDIEFRVDEGSSAFANGSDEGSIRFLHGGNVYGVNMRNNSEAGLSKQAIFFQQPVFGDAYLFPGLGRIMPDVYNSLSWIVGEKHFAVIMNGEVRYCGVRLPYMSAGTAALAAQPIALGSNGNGKRYFRRVCVSQLCHDMRPKVKEGDLQMITKQSNNILPSIHQLITMHYGENYWFNGAAKYVMECLGEPGMDYWFFAGLTGDSLA